MRVRLALEEDEAVITGMVRANMAATRPTLVFDSVRCAETFRGYMNDAAPTIFVAEEDDGNLAGVLVCDFFEHRAACGHFAAQELLYVRPDKRGTRAAALLTKELVTWAGLIGANEIVGGNDNEFNSDRVARFLERFGFKRVGWTMRREI